MRILAHLIPYILSKDVVPEVNEFPLIWCLSTFNFFQVAKGCVPARDGEGVRLIWLVGKGDGGRGRDGWIGTVVRGGDGLRADREGGKTESRWQSWHLSYTKICLEPFSTCLKKKKKKANSAYYAKKRHSQVLTLCDHALPELFTHNRMPRSEQEEIQNPSQILPLCLTRAL